MRKLNLLAGSALILILMIAAGCVKPVDLTLKFNQGKTYPYAHSTNTDIVTNVMGRPMNITQNIGIHFDEKDLTADSAGNRTSEIVFTRLVMDMNLGFFQVSFDSANPDAANREIAAILNRLIGMRFTITTDPEGKVLKVEGLDQLDAMLGQNQGGAGKLGSMFSDGFAEKLAMASNFPMPGKPVQVGDAWTNKRTMSDLGMGALNYEEQLTLERVENGIAYIKSDPKMSGDLFDKEGGVSIGGVGKFKVTEISTEASYEFDLKQGRMIRQYVVIDMTMEGSDPSFGTLPLTVHTVQETKLAK